MKYYLVLFYLFYKDPMKLSCKENRVFDEYEPEAKQLITCESKEEIKTVFNMYFGTYYNINSNVFFQEEVEVDEDVIQTLFRIVSL